MLRRVPLKRGNSVLKRSPIKSKPPSAEKLAEKRLAGDLMRTFFLEIWKRRPHICQNCSAYLGSEPSTVFFDHLLEKSIYPELRLEEKNIFLVCMDCHTAKTNGFPGEKHMEAIEKARELL